jgi:hypothetical protein
MVANTDRPTKDMNNFNDLEDFEDGAFSETFDHEHMFRTNSEISTFRDYRNELIYKLIHKRIQLVGISTKDQTFLETTMAKYNEDIASYLRYGCRNGRSKQLLDLMIKTQTTTTRLFYNDELFAKYEYDEPNIVADAMMKYSIERDLYIVRHLVYKIDQCKNEDMIYRINKTEIAYRTWWVDCLFLTILSILFVCLLGKHVDSVAIGWMIGCLTVLFREVGSLFFV